MYLPKQIITEYLEQLDFSTREAKFYIILLEAGPLSVKDLAKKAKFNRTASYTVIYSLLEKGFITETTKGLHKFFAATDPERLHFLIENKLDTVRGLERKFPEILKLMDQSILKTPRDEAMDTEYFKGENGVKAICNEAFKSNVIRCYAKLSDITPVFFDNHFDRALIKNKKLKIYEIIADAPETVKRFMLEETSKTGRYFYQFAPSTMDLNVSTLIYDNKVAIINTKDELSGVVLHNTDYYNNSKKIFDFMWNIIKKSSLQTT